MLKNQLLKTAVISFCSFMVIGQSYAGGMEPDDYKNSSHKSSKPTQDLSKPSYEELLQMIGQLQKENEELKAITSSMSEEEKGFNKLLATKLSDKVVYCILARSIANQDNISFDESLNKIENSKILLNGSLTLKDILHDTTIETEVARNVFRGVINSIDEEKLFNISKFIYLKSPKNMEEYIMAKMYSGGLVKPICPQGSLVDLIINNFLKVRGAPCFGTAFKSKGETYIGWLF